MSMEFGSAHIRQPTRMTCLTLVVQVVDLETPIKLTWQKRSGIVNMYDNKLVALCLPHPLSSPTPQTNMDFEGIHKLYQCVKLWIGFIHLPWIVHLHWLVGWWGNCESRSGGQCSSPDSHLLNIVAPEFWRFVMCLLLTLESPHDISRSTVNLRV
jgi:hypothetical protein